MSEIRAKDLVQKSSWGVVGEVDAREAVAYLLRINLAAEPQPQRIDSLAQFVESRGGRLDNTMLIALMCLITAMPEYQLC